MTEFKQIVGRGTRVHEDTKKYYFTLMDFRGRPTTSPTRTSTASRSRSTSRARRPDRRRRRSAARSRGRRRFRPNRATTKVSSSDPPDITIRPTATDAKQGLRRRRAGHDRRRARRVPRRERQARHREPPRLHQEGAAEALRQPRRVPYRWKRGRAKQAIIEELADEGLAARAAGRGGRQGPRPLRPDLPRRLRPAAAHPPRAGRERPQAGRLHQVRPAGPRRARGAAGEVPGRRRHRISTTRASCRSAVRRDGHAASSSSSSSAARADFEHAVHELQVRPLPKRPPKHHVRPQHRQVHPGHHAPGRRRRRRRPAHLAALLDVLPEDLDDQDQELELLRRRLPVADPGGPAVAHLGSRSRGHHRRRAARLRQQRAVPDAQGHCPSHGKPATAAAWSAACSRTPTTT